MNFTYGLLPIIILLVGRYVSCFLQKNRTTWLTTAILTGIAAGLWFLVRRYVNQGITDLIILLFLMLSFFEFFQVRDRKRSLVFHCLFYLEVLFIAGSGFFYQESRTIGGYILLILYYLTGSNQRYYNKTYEESAAIYQNQLLDRQVNEVQNIYQTMRGWRHDYHNHLQTLKAHLMLGQTVQAAEYLDRLEEDLSSIHQLIESGNVNLDAILNSKLSLALKEEIEIHYKAEVPAKLTVSDLDLCVLIGNLIDNGVEACNQLEIGTGGRFIRLYIGILKKQLYISVANGTNEPARKLDEEYISAKRGNHGHGLKRINRIIEKYDGFINRKNEPGVFVTEIMLPL